MFCYIKQKKFDKNISNIYFLIHLPIEHMFTNRFCRFIFSMYRGKKLVLATNNFNKKKEMVAILKNLSLDIIGLDRFPEIGNIEESGKTLIDNAFIKARAVFEATGLSSLADDTGLEVDVLNGAPGVYSARYAGHNPSPQDNINKLLKALYGYEEEERNAQFRTIVAFVDSEQEFFSEGIIKGRIIKASKGSKGFGYDSIFKPNCSNQTFAQMNQNEKNKISHRAIALVNMKKKLKKIIR